MTSIDAGKRKRGRPSTYDARREQVMRRAAKVFAERGYHGTSIQDLSEATGFKSGGLYYYIGSKQALLAQIIERFTAAYLEGMRAIVALDDVPVPVILERLAHHAISIADTYPSEQMIWEREAEMFGSDPVWQGAIEAATQIDSTISELMYRGREEGLLDFDDVRIPVFAFGALISAYTKWRSKSARDTNMADELIEVFVYGVGTSKARAARARA